MLANRPVRVVFDAAARMALAFDRTVDGRTLTLEVLEATGFPFRLRDRETGSIWALTGTAVEGPLAGARLPQVATYSAMWFAWASFHRGTELFTPLP